MNISHKLALLQHENGLAKQRTVIAAHSAAIMRLLLRRNREAGLLPCQPRLEFFGTKEGDTLYCKQYT
jgi:hypothetical protein